MDYEDYKRGTKKSNFWFKAKNHLVEEQFRKLKKQNLKILNLGAGTGDDLEVLNKFGKVYVIDINKKELDLIKDNDCVEKKVADACKLPYKNDFFDVVTSFDVFEHIERDDIAVKEVYRVLKKGGSLIFSVPAFQGLYSAHDKALAHFRRYSKKSILPYGLSIVGRSVK